MRIKPVQQSGGFFHHFFLQNSFISAIFPGCLVKIAQLRSFQSISIHFSMANPRVHSLFWQLYNAHKRAEWKSIYFSNDSCMFATTISGHSILLFLSYSNFNLALCWGILSSYKMNFLPGLRFQKEIGNLAVFPRHHIFLLLH